MLVHLTSIAGYNEYMTEFVLGGGCFWCLDAVFRRLKGVNKIECGYAGGSTPHPSYDQVSTGKTGHAEVVKVGFDDAVIPSDTILDIYFLIHNPTTLNQQGADIGTQYRSIMLFADASQQRSFEAARQRAQVIWQDPIVTEISKLSSYYTAEPEHQDYFNKHPDAGYCQIVIEPKITKARQQYREWFKEEE